MRSPRSYPAHSAILHKRRPALVAAILLLLFNREYRRRQWWWKRRNVVFFDELVKLACCFQRGYAKFLLKHLHTLTILL